MVFSSSAGRRAEDRRMDAPLVLAAEPGADALDHDLALADAERRVRPSRYLPRGSIACASGRCCANVRKSASGSTARSSASSARAPRRPRDSKGGATRWDAGLSAWRSSSCYGFRSVWGPRDYHRAACECDPSRRPARGSRSGRPIMDVLEWLGRRWTLRVLWELRDGALPFRALQERCDALSPTVLNERLRELRDAGVVELQEGGGYVLTAEGRGARGRCSCRSTLGGAVGTPRPLASCPVSPDRVSAPPRAVLRVVRSTRRRGRPPRARCDPRAARSRHR